MEDLTTNFETQYGDSAFQRYVNQYGRDSGRKDLLTKILSAKTENNEVQLSDRETSVEIGNLVFAGTGKVSGFLPICQCSTDIEVDTTSTTLTFLFWELSKNQDWQARLREELRTNLEGSATFQQVKDLPVLEAVINEALRLHPAAPASLPRETPAGGAELNGYSIPPKARPFGVRPLLIRSANIL